MRRFAALACVTALTAISVVVVPAAFDAAHADPVGATFSTLGTASFTNNAQCAAANAQFRDGHGDDGPTGIAIAPSGRLFVIDDGGNRVLSWPDADALTECQSADEVIGAGDFTGAEGITVGADNTLYVADTEGQQIDIFKPVGGVYPAAPTVTLGNGTYGSAVNEFTDPRGLALTAQGQLAVADDNDGSIRIFNAPFTTGESATVTVGSGTLGFVKAIAVSGNNIYAVNFYSDEIDRFTGPFTAAGQYPVTARFTTDPNDSQTLNPVDISISPTGSLLVTALDASGQNGPGEVQVFANADAQTANGQVIQDSSVLTLGEQPVVQPLAIVEDSAGRIFWSDYQGLRVIIENPPQTTTPSLRIDTDLFADGTIHTPYPAFQLEASNGTAPYAWSITDGTLPPGMSLTSSGLVSGTPTIAGEYDFTLNVSDSSTPIRHGSLHDQVTIHPMAITTEVLPDATVEATYTATLAEAGGVGTLKWVLANGSVLPPGLKLSTAGKITGTITCQGPAAGCAEGSEDVSITVTDSSKPAQSDTEDVYLPVDPMSITTTAVADGTIGVAYTATKLVAIGGGTLTWAVGDGGQLPPGIKLSTSGQLSGTPTVAITTPGTYTVPVTAHNAKTGAQFQSSSGSFTITIDPMSISTTKIITGAISVQKAFPTFSEKAVGGKSSYHWGLCGFCGSGPLPPGLKLNASNGQISGTPTVPGTYKFIVEVLDSLQPFADQATKTYVVEVLPMTVGGILPNGTLGKSYSQKLTVTGGKASIKLNVTGGALPPGLKMSAQGQITGKPTTEGTFTFTAQALDSGTPQNIATSQLNITIN